MGNKAAHTNMSVDRNQAILSLRNLFNLTHFIDYCYSEVAERQFDEGLLGYNDKIKRQSKSRKNSLKYYLKRIRA